MFLVQSGTVTFEPDFEAARSRCSLSFLRAALSGTVMKIHSRPKAVQFWQGCVFEHRDFRVRHSTQELIGRGFRLRTTRDCNTCPCSGIVPHMLHLFKPWPLESVGVLEVKWHDRSVHLGKAWLMITLGLWGRKRNRASVGWNEATRRLSERRRYHDAYVIMCTIDYLDNRLALAFRCNRM